MAENDKATLQANNVRGPRAGLNSAFTMVANTPQSVDMSTIGPQKAEDGTTALAPDTDKGFLGKYCYIQAIGGNLLIVTGATQASVTGANQPVFATIGQNTAGVGRQFAAGETFQWRPTSVDKWLGFVTDATAVVRIGPA